MRRHSLIAAACLLPSVTVVAAVPLTPAGNGHLVVPAAVNGKGPVPFILDTGADGTGVYDWFARQQRLKPGVSRAVEGMTGTTTMPTYMLQSVAIDGHVLRGVTADSYPDRIDQEITAGVAGNDLMDGAIAVFDFPCRQVSLLPKPVRLDRLLTPDAKMVVGGRVKDGTQLTFPIRVGNATGVAVLDTGSRETKLNLAFARAAGIDPSASTFRVGETIYGANAQGMTSRTGPIGTVRFADTTIPNARAQVMDLPVLKSFGFDGPAMIFGLDLMRGLRIVYDHQAGRFWFDRSRCGGGKHLISRQRPPRMNSIPRKIRWTYPNSYKPPDCTAAKHRDRSTRSIGLKAKKKTLRWRPGTIALANMSESVLRPSFRQSGCCHNVTTHY